MVPQLLAASGNPPYLDLWVISGDPEYPGYKTLAVAPEPSIAWVAGAVHSMGGKIGTYMKLWALLRDSEV
jgi:hypothetical protein